MSLIIVDIIGECVGFVSTDLTPVLSQYDPNITNVNYMHGPPKEMINTLTDWTKLNGKDKDKYPVVMLFESFTTTVTDEIINAADIRIIIARRNSDPKLKAKQRYANNITPVLMPVCEALLKQMVLHSNISSNYKIDHKANIWPFWGGDDQQAANPFNDKLDIIELKINNLVFKPNFNC